MSRVTSQRIESSRTFGRDSDLFRRFRKIEESMVFAETRIKELESQVEALELKISKLEGNS